jgi:Dyp-type peroxidase family
MQLELDDIQATVLRNRPMPYAGQYIFMRIRDAEQTRTLLGRLIAHITPSGDWQQPEDSAWINIVFTYAGLQKLGVPEAILREFPREFREPMPTRKHSLGDLGESDPSNWDYPFGSSDLHLGLMLMAPHQAALDVKVAIGKKALEGLPGVEAIGTLNVELPQTFREHFGFADGISRPFIEGQGGQPLPGQGTPIKAGEFFLGYENELGVEAKGPGPRALWRNGTYLSIRKLHQKVAEWRAFLQDRSKMMQEDEEFIAAKVAGRWRSGCPLALAPTKDDPELGKDRQRNNAFQYAEDDERGYKTPLGSHIRRVNPRDALDHTITNARLHKILRRGSSYGPSLPEGVMTDDGISRGIVIAFVNADPARQFEFVQSQWVNDGDFIGAGHDRDPLAAVQNDNAQYVFPAKPIRRKMIGMPSFVVTKGGEHVFLPGIQGIRWLANAGWNSLES